MMKRRHALSTTAILLLLVPFTAQLLAEEPAACPALVPDTEFVDLHGRLVSPTEMDAIALREAGDLKVVVYQRNLEDAVALVERLQSQGITDPLALAPESWLAQAPACRMRPNGTCEGRCPGKQTCRRIKRPGKPDLCQCLLR